MAFIASDLSVLAYANNFTLWHYTSTDNTIETADYFNPAASMLNVNDLIIANIDTDGSPLTKFYIVTGNSSGSITVTVYT